MQELAAAYEKTWKRVAQTILIWNEFNVIYGNLENLNLSNETAPLFFRIVEDALWQEVNLEISRLTDNLVVAGHKTDGLRRLVTIAITDGNLSDSDELIRELDSTIADCQAIRKKRNQVIAHSDVGSDEAVFIPREEKEETEKALNAIVKFMNFFENSIGVAPIMYFEVGNSPWGAQKLVVALRKAQASELHSHQLLRTEEEGRVRWRRRIS